ncbi:uncharacterized protein B0H18DRAFT_1112359 [Fomitopsis serialis]|uniref:uncharacterized protein n=1 Tax=Fomitopsis serialis TaxID=139415 RepID=UPI002008C3F0|nr:uncharacterized protein B0H18DRAFT_1112359 [Neoantrodia serialis]KAH9938178.1 hypothetical protein B0H18DRAFT_1112359 [Neoantrodia serialis]
MPPGYPLRWGRAVERRQEQRQRHGVLAGRAGSRNSGWTRGGLLIGRHGVGARETRAAVDIAPPIGPSAFPERAREEDDPRPSTLLPIAVLPPLVLDPAPLGLDPHSVSVQPALLRPNPDAHVGLIPQPSLRPLQASRLPLRRSFPDVTILADETPSRRRLRLPPTLKSIRRRLLPPKQAPLARPKSSFFRSLSRRAQPPAGPLITVDGDHPPSSSSSSSAGPSTPDDDARSFVRAKTWLYQTDVAPPTQTAVHVQASLIVPQAAGLGSAARLGLTLGRPNAQVEHDSDDESSSSEFSRGSAHTPTVLSSRSRVSQQAMPTPTSHAAPTKPLSAVDYAKALANNGLSHPFSPPPLLHIPNSPLFPRSCNAHSQVSSLASDSLRTQLLQKRVLARLSRPSRADERVLLPFAGRHHPQPKGPHLLLDDSAVSGRDRLVVYRPVEEGEGVNRIWKASEHLEDLAGLYDDLTEDTTVTADTETDAATEVTFTLTTSPTVEPPKTQDIPVSIEFPRRSSQDVHAAPALNVDVDLGGLGDLIDFEPKLSTDSSPAQLTPPLSLTASSASPSPTSSGPPTPTVTVSTGAVAGNAPDVKESVKGDAGSRTPSSSPQQPPGEPRFSRLLLDNTICTPLVLCVHRSFKLFPIYLFPSLDGCAHYLIFVC